MRKEKINSYMQKITYFSVIGNIYSALHIKPQKHKGPKGMSS